MYLEARKINLIQEVLNINNDVVLDQIENILRDSHPEIASKPSIYDFVEKLTKEEAEEFERVIMEATETIHPDDWK